MKKYVVGFERTKPIIDDCGRLIGEHTHMEEVEVDTIEELITHMKEAQKEGYRMSYLVPRNVDNDELISWCDKLKVGDTVTQDDLDYIYYLIDKTNIADKIYMEGSY